MKTIITDQDERIGKFVSDGVGNDESFLRFSAVGLEKDGELIAGVVYHDYNGRSISASIYGVGKTWMTREFLWFMFFYPFEQAKVGRITITVEENNKISHNFVKKLGFSHEATLQKAGKYGDLHIYRMFREECKWLKVSKREVSINSAYS